MKTKNIHFGKLAAISFSMCVALAMAVSSSAEAQVPAAHFKKVVWIVLENTGYDTTIRQNDFKSLVQQGVLFTNLSAETRPSQGNYIAMIAGSTLGVRSDGNVNLKDNHIGDLLESHGLDWRAYAEGFPGNCFVGVSSGNYYRKHNPFMSFLNVTTDKNRCGKIVPGSSFFDDLKQNKLPAYSMYIPDMQNDGHDTDVDFAGKWLTRSFGEVFKNPQIMADTLFVITFDEGEVFGPNHIFTVVLGGLVKPGATNSQTLNHFSLLKLIEDEFALGDLGKSDHTAQAIEGLWQ